MAKQKVAPSVHVNPFVLSGKALVECGCELCQGEINRRAAKAAAKAASGKGPTIAQLKSWGRFDEAERRIRECQEKRAARQSM